jgi:hypothetical protein
MLMFNNIISIFFSHYTIVVAVDSSSLKTGRNWLSNSASVSLVEDFEQEEKLGELQY